MELDRRTRRVRIDGDEVALTAKEFDLLAFLANDVGAVHTRTEILETVWDAHWYGPTKTVDAHVASLRKKLGDHALDRGRSRRRLPVGTAVVRWRLLAAFVGVMIVILAAQVIPLARYLRTVESERLVASHPA